MSKEYDETEFVDICSICEREIPEEDVRRYGTEKIKGITYFKHICNSCLEKLKKEGKAHTYDLALFGILVSSDRSSKENIRELAKILKKNGLYVYKYGRLPVDKTFEEWEQFFDDWIGSEDWWDLEDE